MTTPAPYTTAERPEPYPRMKRASEGSVVAGVASGVSAHLNVDVLLVRVVFAAASVASGVGLFVYASLWMLVKTGDVTPVTGNFSERFAAKLPRGTNGLIIAFAIVAPILVATMGVGLSIFALLPLIIVAVGAFLAWRAYDRGLSGTTGIISAVSGAVLVFAGILFMALSWQGNDSFGAALVAVLLTLVGIGALVVPLGVRMWNQLTEQQAAKAVSDERAEIASRLHDSVLQTLALIQKRADDPQEVARLARGQERELRGWLFDSEEKTAQTVFAALESACGEVEDLFGITIRPVTVGEDIALTEDTKLTVMAAREAMVNAGKHAGVDSVDVYAEHLAGELSIFVRDRGDGFDSDAIPEDRHGIRDSIVERMSRIGGSAKIKSAPGDGTEVTVTIEG
ncbi:ATP-binding protein [Corynebacterium ammoniagenes]|uniref:Two-component system sensor kinase n=2 Tax=Corynebacterium ammoniagenes TaxID=1697 RepID=A0AAV5G1C0_CORAM|nr:ATP-binding protein [Corynebacterium ammoniagenes]AQS73038.1 ATP-binding protein [Corynebacterium ammoniagenes]NMF31694.1 PspC domain-containing protein [Corynebacterium ammoniagenes]GJN41724.1 two-component system sensor kinase [Corynebacterium ammoniagenes]